MSVPEWLAFASKASLYSAREKARAMGITVIWDCEKAKTPDGYYQIRGGIEYAIAKALAAGPFADVLWMETKTADLSDARKFADAIHAAYPDKMLAYNLSPSFNWDTTGMTEVEMQRFPEELGKMGFVFNFITYGGHQVDGLVAEEFATALRQEGMLALARLQRKFRLVESPYRTPQTLVGGPRADAGLMAISGRTSTTKAMGKGSTQFQHAIQTEVPSGTYLDMSANLPVLDPQKILVPTLIMRGQYDGIAAFQDLANFFAKLPNPDKQFVVMPGIAHTSTRSKNYALVYHLLDGYFSQPAPVYSG